MKDLSYMHASNRTASQTAETSLRIFDDLIIGDALQLLADSHTKPAASLSG